MLLNFAAAAARGREAGDPGGRSAPTSRDPQDLPYQIPEQFKTPLSERRSMIRVYTRGVQLSEEAVATALSDQLGVTPTRVKAHGPKGFDMVLKNAKEVKKTAHRAI